MEYIINPMPIEAHQYVTENDIKPIIELFKKYYDNEKDIPIIKIEDGNLYFLNNEDKIYASPYDYIVFDSRYRNDFVIVFEVNFCREYTPKDGSSLKIKSSKNKRIIIDNKNNPEFEKLLIYIDE